MIFITIFTLYFFIILQHNFLIDYSYADSIVILNRDFFPNDTKTYNMSKTTELFDDIMRTYEPYTADPPGQIIKLSGEFSKKWTIHTLIYPHEAGMYYQGDIFTHLSSQYKINLWPNGTVVYYIDKKSIKDYLITYIEDAMTEIEEQTCLHFKKESGEPIDLIFQSHSRGCYTNHIGNVKELNISFINLDLDGGCFDKLTIMHEILHVFGFRHEQNRPDRDEYVTIMWEQIRPVHVRNFEKDDPSIVDTFGLPYDFNSIMHYSEYAFSKSNEPTIVSKRGEEIARLDGLSPYDIMRIQKMYNCPNTSLNINKTGMTADLSGENSTLKSIRKSHKKFVRNNARYLLDLLYYTSLTISQIYILVFY